MLIKGTFIASTIIAGLPKPVFGSVTKTDSAVSLSVINLPSGAAVVWTFNSVTDATQTSGTFSKTGLNASTSYTITAKFTKSGYNDSAVTTTTITTNTAGGYAVDRRIRINLSNEYTTPSNISSPKWNDMMLKSSEIGVANGFVSTFLATETSAATLIKITNPTTWAGASATILSPYPTTALYPATIGNTGLQFNSWDSPPQLKLIGLEAAKYYQLYIAVLSDGASDVMNIGIGADVKTKSSYNNVGVNTDVEMQSPVWTVFNNKQGTEITINFSKNAGGSSFFVTAIIVEETTIQKP